MEARLVETNNVLLRLSTLEDDELLTVFVAPRST